MTALLALLLALPLQTRVPTADDAPKASTSMTLDPFVAGPRWTWGSTGADPWIPRSVAFAARGELVWSAPAVGGPRLALLSGAAEEAGPLLVDGDLAGAVGPPLVRAGDDADELFAAVQFDAGALGARRTELWRHDAPEAASSGAGFGARWKYDPGVTTVRPPQLAVSADGERAVLAVHDGSGVLVDWIDVATGSVDHREFLNGAGLDALALSADGDRVAVVAGLQLWVVDRDGTVRLNETLAAATSALALSADGRTLAVGGFGHVALRRLDAGPGFEALDAVTGVVGELPTRVALDAQGVHLAIGWWTFTTGLSARLEVVDLGSMTTLVERVQAGTAGSPQNFPQALALTPDGARVALGLWGSSDPRPEILLVDVPTNGDVLAVDLPGSVEDLTLDPTGTRIAAAVKDTHANAFGSTGAVELFDTGERDLQVIAPPTPGGKLRLAAVHPDQEFTLFVVGAPAPVPLPLPDVGTGYLDVTKSVHLFGASADGVGRAFRSLNIPANPSVTSAEFAVQAIFLSPVLTQLSSVAVQPVIL